MATDTMSSVRWWALTRGDIDATVAQSGLNLAQLLIPVFLLVPAGVPLLFGITHFVPGFALGMLVASFGYVALAVQIRNREGRTDVTAHPYGTSVPAMIAYTLGIMLPTYLQTHDPEAAWRMGAAAVVWTGIIKLLAAPFAGLIRRFTPKTAMMGVFSAAMYSYLLLVLIQRIFDQPFLGIIALTIVVMCVLGNVSITSWRIPPFLVAWLVPLAIGLGIQYVHPVWTGASIQIPFIWPAGLMGSLVASLPFFSVIVPMSIYHILQDIASVEGASSAGDEYNAPAVLFVDGIGTLVCGLAGSVIAPLVYATHPPFKHIGTRIGFSVWTPLIVLAVVVSGILLFVSQLFPWPILSAFLVYISVGVGRATLNRVDRPYYPAILLGFIIPAGAVVSLAVGNVLPQLGVRLADPMVQAVLNRTIFWQSIQGLSNGFLTLVLVITAMLTEVIDRHFGRAAVWCFIGSAFSWVGLMHSATFRWGAQPPYALGWLIAGLVVMSAQWWRGPEMPMHGAAPAHHATAPVAEKVAR
jgi:AGZA family xanthine/uracil permease-like MFS transporter